MNDKPKPCPGCNRPRSQCWAEPCWYLDKIMLAGPTCLAGWAEGGGGKLVEKKDAVFA